MINWQHILFRLLFPIFLSTTAVGICLAEDTFELGNQAYSKGNFPAAARNYLETATTDGVSPSLLYNLANTYAEMGETGEAIRAYEQALRLDHGNGDINSNLAVIRKDNGLYREDRPIWQRFTDLLGPDQWMLLAGFSFSIFSTCLLAYSLINSMNIPVQKDNAIRLTRYMANMAFIATLITLPPAIYGYQSWNDGVVLTDSRLLVSPFATAASGGTVKEGRVVRPIQHHKDFVLVMDTSGQRGWLHQKNLGFIRELPEKMTER